MPFARAYDMAFDIGDLWVTSADAPEVALLKSTGTQVLRLTDAQPGTTVYSQYLPRRIRVLPDGSAIVVTAERRVLRVRPSI